MRRDQLEHAIRTACQIVGHSEVIIVGSQAILGSIDEADLPPVATMSMEIDVLPIATTNEETARLADRSKGWRESSPVRRSSRVQYRRRRPEHCGAP